MNMKFMKIKIMTILVLSSLLIANDRDIAKKKNKYANIPGKAIKAPKPTCWEPDKTVPLKIVLEMPSDQKNDVFILMPGNLVVDEKGNVYVGDCAQTCIFIFNKDLQATKQIGRSGQGPGEFSTNKSFMYHLYYKNKILYATDIDKRCIHLFSTETGNSLTDIKLTYVGLSELISFGVAVDENNRIYANSGRRPGLFVQLNQNGKVAETYLKQQYYEDLPFSLFTELKNVRRLSYISSVKESCYFAYLGQDKFFVYLSYPSKYYIVEKGIVVRKSDILPSTALKQLAMNLSDKTGLKTKRIFRNCFVDQDDPRYFYLERTEIVQGKIKKVLLYQFDFAGKLNRILSLDLSNTIETDIRLQCKRNNTFYGLKNSEEEFNIITCKEQL